jgi:hypothetical protein
MAKFVIPYALHGVLEEKDICCISAMENHDTEIFLVVSTLVFNGVLGVNHECNLPSSSSRFLWPGKSSLFLFLLRCKLVL